MKLRTLVRDALYLTWAVPSEALPEPPAPLRYQKHRFEERDHSFVSAVVSRHEGLELPILPRLHLSYSQLNLFTYVLDGEGTPSVLVQHVWMPLWLTPGARLVTGFPISGASFDCPQPSLDPTAEAWSWRVSGEGRLALSAERGAPRLGPGPRFPSWDALVEALRERETVYSLGAGRLHKVRVEVESKAVWPMKAEVTEASLLSTPLSGMNGRWPPVYAAWLDAELPMIVELGRERQVALSGVPAPG